MKVALQNIHNEFNNIYYTVREGLERKLIEVNDFIPYYYEPHPDGDYKGYDGQRLIKLHADAPYKVKRERTDQSYEADILYTKRFVIDNIEEIEKSKTKYALYDIEVKAEKEFPEASEAKFPVTFITIWDNYSKEYKVFDYRKYNSEHDMLTDFISYIKELELDILLAWNHEDFDYPYLYNRYPDFAKAISPIGQETYNPEGASKPALLGIIDLLALDYKYTLGKRDSYALDNVLQEEFEEEEAWGETDWLNDDDHVHDKNINDVKRMVKLVEKHNYIEHFDEIRRETCCLWEDIQPKKVGYTWQSNNSKPIDMMFLKEAKAKNVVLPSKQDNEKESYDGAYRDIFEKGVFTKGIGKYDLSSAYPQAIVDFCLDPANFSEEDGEDKIKINLKDRVSKDIKATYYFKQNEDAILPSVVKKLLGMKQKLKDEMNNADPDSEESKILDTRYATVKALINSLYGVLGNRFFRLYKKEVAETDTFLIRDLLEFVKAKIESNGYKVIYIDTDSVFIEGKENLTDKLNKYVLEWGMDNYERRVNIRFDYEGYFDKLFLVALCRYIGYVVKPNGKIKREIKGIQMKRRDANIHKKEYQEALLEYVMEGHPKEDVLNYIQSWIDKVETQPIEKLGNPCKFSKKREDYKKNEIFFRAYDNTQEDNPKFEKEIGQKFFWVYLEDDREVYAFDDKTTKNVPKLDYNKVITNDIFNVSVPVFRGLHWGKELLDLGEKNGVILKSDYRNDLLEDYENTDELKKYYGARQAKKRMSALTNSK